MAYATNNPKTKKKLKELVALGKVKVYQPGGMFSLEKGPGTTTIEGPHFPEAHRWYARVEYDENFVITKVLK